MTVRLKARCCQHCQDAAQTEPAAGFGQQSRALGLRAVTWKCSLVCSGTPRCRHSLAICASCSGAEARPQSRQCSYTFTEKNNSLTGLEKDQDVLCALATAVGKMPSALPCTRMRAADNAQQQRMRCCWQRQPSQTPVQAAAATAEASLSAAQQLYLHRWGKNAAWCAPCTPRCSPAGLRQQG